MASGVSLEPHALHWRPVLCRRHCCCAVDGVPLLLREPSHAALHCAVAHGAFSPSSFVGVSLALASISCNLVWKGRRRAGPAVSCGLSLATLPPDKDQMAGVVLQLCGRRALGTATVPPHLRRRGSICDAPRPGCAVRLLVRSDKFRNTPQRPLQPTVRCQRSCHAAVHCRGLRSGSRVGYSTHRYGARSTPTPTPSASCERWALLVRV